MGFKYVLVPASPNDVLQELTYDSDVEELTKDTFREFVEKYFSGCGQAVDRSVLLQQLQQRTGVDLKAPGMKGPDLDRLLTSTSVEIFPMQLPTKESSFNAISVYCDDKGIAKNLEENARVSGLAQACGYHGQTFRGDCFVGRVYDDTEDVWRRTDFTLADMSTDAPWVACVRKQREKRSSGDLASLANSVGAKNPAHISPATMEDNVPKGETDQYRWRQAEEEVEVTFKKEGLEKGDKKAVKVKFLRQHLCVEVKGEALFDGELYGATTPEDSTWTLSDGVLQVTLCKAETETWPRLLRRREE